MLNRGFTSHSPVLRADLPLSTRCGCFREVQWGWEERLGREDGLCYWGCCAVGWSTGAQTWPSSNKLPCLCIIVHCSLYFCIKMQRLTVDLEKSATELPPKVFNPPFNSTCPGRSTSSSGDLAVGCCSGSQIWCPALTFAIWGSKPHLPFYFHGCQSAVFPQQLLKQFLSCGRRVEDKLRCKWNGTGSAVGPDRDCQCSHCFLCLLIATSEQCVDLSG